MKGFAPDWMLRCAVCGRAADAAEAGVVRIGATSVGKRVAGRCKGCGRLRMLILEKVTEEERITAVKMGKESFTFVLADGRELRGPYERFPALAAATPKDRDGWVLGESGFGVTWP